MHSLQEGCLGNLSNLFVVFDANRNTPTPQCKEIVQEVPKPLQTSSALQTCLRIP